MQTQSIKRRLCGDLGRLLEYPVQDYHSSVLALAEQVLPLSGESADLLKLFFSRMKRMNLEQCQEYYVQTFDLMPQCALYLSVHLFGEESFKRAELMAGLKKVYVERGQHQMEELPDHLAIVLRQSLSFDDHEWSELVHMCILPALPIMIKKLENNANPYALILKAVKELLMERAHV